MMGTMEVVIALFVLVLMLMFVGSISSNNTDAAERLSPEVREQKLRALVRSYNGFWGEREVLSKYKLGYSNKYKHCGSYMLQLLKNESNNPEYQDWQRTGSFLCEYPKCNHAEAYIINFAEY